MKQKICCLLLSALNIVFAVYFLICYFSPQTQLASNVLGIIGFAVIIFDIIIASLFKTAGAFVQITAAAVLFAVNYASNYIAGLSRFAYPDNIIAIVSLTAIYLNNAIFFARAAKRDGSRIRPNKIISALAGAAAVLFNLIICAVGLVSLLAKTQINTNTVNTVYLFAVLCAFALGAAVLLEDKKSIKTAAAAAFVLALIPLAVMQTSAARDIKNADASFERAYTKTQAVGNMRETPYSVTNEFTGISADGFTINRDVVYYTSDSGFDRGMTLRCDIYSPEDETASRYVLVNLHGSGGDKDIGNFAHRNKYFASRGFVVYDLQFGDWNEKDTGFTEDMYSAENMLFHIDEFFKYLSENNSEGADLSNVYITGVSMGGTLTSKYAYSFGNNLEQYGITLRGIIPVYPGYSPEDTGIHNYLNYVDESSVPCLIVMGSSDCVVRPQTLGETAEAYENAGNPNCVALEISYAGHSSDCLMTGRTNQMITYYAEQFVCATHG